MSEKPAVSKGTKYEGHTSGPWRECGRDRGGCVCGLVWHPERDFTIAVALNADCKEHEGCTGGEGLIGPATIKANATLIADAPALLACALELREALEVFWHKAGSPLRIGVPDKGFLSAMDVLNRFDALTGVSAARVAGKGGGKP